MNHHRKEAESSMAGRKGEEHIPAVTEKMRRRFCGKIKISATVTVKGYRKAAPHTCLGKGTQQALKDEVSGLGDPSFGQEVRQWFARCQQGSGRMGSPWLLRSLAGSLRATLFTPYLGAWSRDELGRLRQMVFIHLLCVAVLDCT